MQIKFTSRDKRNLSRASLALATSVLVANFFMADILFRQLVSSALWRAIFITGSLFVVLGVIIYMMSHQMLYVTDSKDSEK